MARAEESSQAVVVFGVSPACAQLRTGEGQTITVALDGLSAADQEFLRASQG